MIPVYSIMEIIVKPSQVPNFYLYAQRLTRSARSEPGCTFYQWSQKDVGSNTFILVQNYVSAAAYNEHITTPVMQNWENRDKKLLLLSREKVSVYPVNTQDGIVYPLMSS